jgi:hypothetical protein
MSSSLGSHRSWWWWEGGDRVPLPSFLVFLFLFGPRLLLCSVFPVYCLSRLTITYSIRCASNYLSPGPFSAINPLCWHWHWHREGHLAEGVKSKAGRPAFMGITKYHICLIAYHSPNGEIWGLIPLLPNDDPSLAQCAPGDCPPGRTAQGPQKAEAGASGSVVPIVSRVIIDINATR